jgi:hypothetical protein
MQGISVNLDGIPTKIQRIKVPLSKLILDIENPRIQYFLDTSLNKDITQDKVKFALAEGNDQYDKLKEHIETNGGIYDPIWITPKDNYYIVIEGNTRAYIYEELSEKYINDIKWKVIDSYILPKMVDRNVINFIRLEKHLFGQTPWAAYEKARELYRLNINEDYPISRLERLTKLSANEIRNSIQAFKDMEEQYLKKFNKPSERFKYSYFVEFRKNKELKKLVKEGKVSLMDFCDWVGNGKFKKGEEVRKLAVVLNDPQAKQALIDDNFQTALDQLEQKIPSAKSKLFEKIDDVVFGLKNMKFYELNEIKGGFQPAKYKSLKTLQETINDFLVGIEVKK